LSIGCSVNVAEEAATFRNALLIQWLSKGEGKAGWACSLLSSPKPFLDRFLDGAPALKIQIVRGEAGFTLIEVMIAAAILTIAAGLALPEFLRWHVQTQLRQATSEIATQLTLARMAAMNRNRNVDVTVQLSGGSLHVSAVAPSSGELVIRDKTFPTSVTTVIGSPVMVSYSSLGIRTSGGTGTQTIGVCDRYKRQYSVTVIPSGKVNWSINSSAIPCP